MTPQRLWQSEPKPQNKPEKKNPSGCRQPAISHTVHTKMRQNVLDQSAGLSAMVGGGRTRPRPPVLTPRGAGDRRPPDPSRRTPAGGPPTRDASDVGSQSPRTSNRRDTCHKVITDHCRFLGRCPFCFWSWTPQKRNRTGGDGDRPRPKAPAGLVRNSEGVPSCFA